MKRNVDIRKIVGKITMSDNMKKFVKKLTLKREELVEKMSKKEIEEIIESYDNASEEEKESISEIALIYHFPIALTIVKKFSVYIDPNYIDDMIQTLFMSIVTSLQSYDKSKGYKYHTYLSNTLMGIAMKFLDASRMIKFNYYYVKKKYGEDYINYNLRTILESEIAELGEEELDIDSYLYHEHEDIYKEDVPNFDYIYYVMEQCLAQSGFTEIEKRIIHDIFISHQEKTKTKNSYVTKKFNVDVSYVYALKKKFISVLSEKLSDYASS